MWYELIHRKPSQLDSPTTFLRVQFEGMSSSPVKCLLLDMFVVLFLVEVTAASVHCMTMTFEGLSNTKLRDLVLVLDKRTTGQIFAGGVVEDDCESVTYCGHRPMERTWYLGTSVFSSFFSMSLVHRQ